MTSLVCPTNAPSYRWLWTSQRSSLRFVTDVAMSRFPSGEAKLERPPCFSPDGQLLAIRRSSNAVEFRDTSDWQLHHLWKPGEGGKNTSEDLVYSAISYTMIGLGFSP